MHQPSRLLAACLIVAFTAVSTTGCAFQRHSGSGAGADVAAALAPTPCPSVNDLAGIEGYAPGAGGAEHIGRDNGGMFGAMSGAAAGNTPAPPTKPPAANCYGLSPQLAAGFDEAAEVYKSIPTIGYDPVAMAQALPDADATFAFVRDQLGTEAYAGVMRGPSGTLMNRAGSPADKALLLASLLSAKRIPVRFVHSTLTDADVSTIVDAVLAAKPAQTQAPTAPEQLTAQIRSMLSQALAQAQPVKQDLLGRLAASGAQLAADDSALRAAWTLNLRDHWWVQAQENGAWVDLDPTLANASAGTHMGPAPVDDPVNALPDSLYTTIAFRVTGDFGADGAAAQTRTLVEKQVKAADVYAQPILIRIGDANVTLDKIAQSKDYTAAVTVGDETATGPTFSPDDGSGAQLQRLQLQIETDRPGMQPLIAQRIVAQRSPAWTPQTQAYALTTVYYGLAMAGDLDPGLVLQRWLEGLAAYKNAIESVGQGNIAAGAVMPTYPVAVMQYVMTDAALRRWIGSQSSNGTRFFFNRPVIAFVRGSMKPDANSFDTRRDFDVVDDAMNAVGTDMRTAHTDNLERGVVDDALESLAIGSQAATNTRAVFAAARQSNVPIVVSSSAGSARIAPSHAITVNGSTHTGWWEIDTASGSTVGRMDYGAGQAMSEYAQVAKDLARAFNEAMLISNTARCTASGMSAALSGGKDAVSQTMACDLAALCTYMANLVLGMGADAYAVNRFFLQWAQTLFGLLVRGYNAASGTTGRFCRGEGFK